MIVREFKCLLSSVIFAGLVVPSGVVLAEGFPNKPIRILTTEAGGGGDLVARVIAQGLAESFRQPVIVDNRGIRGAEIVAKAPPDGYTLLSYGNPLWLAPFLRSSVPFDPIMDFAPILLSVSSPNILVVSPAVPAKNVAELIALAKAKPGVLNYASSGIGSSNHLAAELFKAMTGSDIVHVPYRGAGPGMTATLTGEVQIMFPSASSVVPHIKSGKLRGLAVTSAGSSRVAPGLPTVSSSGVAGYESSLLLGMFAPAGTQVLLIRRLNEETIKVLKGPEVQDRLLRSGVDVVASTPGEFAERIKGEMSRMGPLIRQAGIRAD
jgi:tripartite-type tricarboxylate transporter receptor subunit TctC